MFSVRDHECSRFENTVPHVCNSFGQKGILVASARGTVYETRGPTQSGRVHDGHVSISITQQHVRYGLYRQL